MIVKWNKQRIIIVPIPLDTKTKKVDFGAPKVRLLPGTNEIPEDVWELIKPSLKLHISEKNLEVMQTSKEVVKEDKDGKEKKVTETTFPKLSDLSPEDCLGLIAQCNNLETLRAWRKADTRDEIRLAVKDRISEIKDYINKKIENENKGE